MNLSSLTFLLLVLFGSLASLTAQTTFTNGTGNSLWNDSGNWSAGIPSFTVDAIVPMGVATTLTISTGVHAEAMSLDITNVELIIALDASLSIKNGTIQSMNFKGTSGLSNFGTINITDKLSALGSAIRIQGTGLFKNHPTGVINIESSNAGIFIINNTLTNEGHINIGPNLNDGAIAFFSGILLNQSGASINVLGSGSGNSHAIVSVGGTNSFTNNGVLCINSAAVPDLIGPGIAFTQNGTYTTSGCVATSPAPPGSIPTLGQWAMIVLALLMGVIATLVMQARMRPAVVGTPHDISLQALPFDRKRFVKTLVLILATVVAIFVVSIAAFGYEMTSADVPGALIACPVGAYLISLWGK